MADGLRFPPQGTGNYYFQPHTQQPHTRHTILRSSTPPNNRSAFNVNTPSPSRSPDSHSPAPPYYGMYSQPHQPGHARVNGGPGSRGIAGGVLNYNYNQQQNNHHHTQHHNAVQHDHSGHTTNGAVLGHHTSYSSGVLSNSTPSFTPSSMQNGHSATTRGGQAQQITEHWAKQLEMHKESERHHEQWMNDGHRGNYFARLKAGENRGTATQPDPVEKSEGDSDELGRMSNQSALQRRQDWHNMDLSGQGFKVLAAPLFNYMFLKELYLASNQLKFLPPSIGQLRHLTLLDVSNNQLAELPPELGLCVYMTQLLVFDNSIHTLPNELGSLFQLEMLGIEGNPLNADMKQVIMEKGTKSLIEMLREQAPMPMPPPDRAVVDVTKSDTSGQEKFRVFSFNILSDQACTQRLYGYSPQGALTWEYRRDQILKEIRDQDADFVCLQEVDTDTFQEFFREKLAYNDYKGVFWPRSRAKTMSEKDAKNVDGCATFYKQSKYILLDKQLVDFANIAINRPDMKNQHDIFNRVMPRDHIGVVTFFENRLTGSRLILVNTHFFWDPVYADVKLIQTAILLGEINKLAEKYVHEAPRKDKKAYTLKDEKDEDVDEPIPEPSKEYSSKINIPLVICADQNSTADSTVFQLLAKGTVNPDHHEELKDRSYGNFTKNGMEHPFSLRSAYTNIDRTEDEVPFTNYTPGFRGVIDHIWYSTNALENTALLGKVDPAYMATVPGFPNYHFPSDHLSLMAEFSVKNTKTKKITEPDFGPSSRSNDRRRG